MLIEGYFFEVGGRDIFYVKGVVNPPEGVIGFPKYIKDPRGDRVNKKGERYRKIPGIEDEIHHILKFYQGFMRYDEFFCGEIPIIPMEMITRVYDPIIKAMNIIELRNTDGVISDVRDMVNDIINATNVKSIGVSGSILVDLYREDSDIDLVIYGEKEGRRVYEYLAEVIDKNSSQYRRYSINNIEKLFRERSKETPIEIHELLKQESRRVLEGLYRNREYFIRLIRYPEEDELYGAYKCVKVGRVVAKLMVVDDRYAIYTPCRYGVQVIEIIDGENISIDEVYTLRGRFIDIAKQDDIIIASGTVEKIIFRNGNILYRLYLGNKGDYVIKIK